MTHSEIYKKFMIEYDKANITSSYPSLTKYEIATILDKAYLALIAQKVTGNNQRKSGFESDIKAIEDLRPLVTTVTKDVKTVTGLASNEDAFDVPEDLLYIVKLYTNLVKDDVNKGTASVDIITHELASKYKVTINNLPWMENPVAYVDSNYIHILFDSFKYDGASKLDVTYIKQPVSFVNKIDYADSTDCELTPTTVEELINLAIVFATEIVESPRLQTKSSILSLES